MTKRMRAVFVAVLLSFLLVPIRAQQRAPEDTTLRVRLQGVDPARSKETLEQRGYDVLWANEAQTAVDVVVSAIEWRELQLAGWSGVVVERGRPFERTAASLVVATPGTAAVVADPAYKDLDGIVARLHEIAAAYPSIAQVVDVTATYGTPATAEGRHLFALKISDNVAVDEDEPAMLVVAAHHAREISTPVIALAAADRFTSGYGVDPRITAAVDGNELWIAPVWNPDGYNHVFVGDNMWRKNRRVFSSGIGVDQNRNYAQGWTASCSGSTSPSSDVYKGPAAASEAETITMQVWSRAERFAKVLDYHSYGREVLYGYRCMGHPFTTWMQQEAAKISVASGYGGLTRVPSAEGEHQEWQFAKMAAYAFLIETHTVFQPTYASAVAEADLVWPGLLSVVERPISVQGHVTDAVTGAPLAATIELVSVTFTNGETNASGGLYGAYHMFVPSGTYHVRFSAPNYAPVVLPVTAVTGSTTTLNVALEPEALVFTDDFETDKGWIRNPTGIDSATTGHWERGVPQSTQSGGAKQLRAASGVYDLSTGPLAGSSASANDVDGGYTSIQSPEIVLPAKGTLTLTFNYYFAHASDSSSTDSLRVMVLGDTKMSALLEVGTPVNDNAFWTRATVDLTPFAGQTIRLLISATDGSSNTLVEAAVDDVKVVRR